MDRVRCLGERRRLGCLGSGGERRASPRQLTHGPGDSAIPSWSRDGRSIYFTSKRSGRFEVWRVPAQGGTAEQITRNGGFLAFESTDGRTLYYTVSEIGAEGLYANQVPDGDENQVMKEEVAARGFAVFSDGVYYLHRRGQASAEIRFHEFASGRVHVIGKIEETLLCRFGGVSRPEDIPVLKRVRSTSDLMMIENFRRLARRPDDFGSSRAPHTGTTSSPPLVAWRFSSGSPVSTWPKTPDPWKWKQQNPKSGCGRRHRHRRRAPAPRVF